MTTRTRRLTALALALAMTFALAITATAAEVSEETIRPRGVTCDCGGSLESRGTSYTSWALVEAHTPCDAHNNYNHSERTEERTAMTQYVCNICSFSYTQVRTETRTYCKTSN